MYLPPEVGSVIFPTISWPWQKFEIEETGGGRRHLSEIEYNHIVWDGEGK